MIGTGIKYFRILRNISQNDFALKLKTTQPYLSAIENNRKNPSIEFLAKTSKVLKVPVPALYWFGISADDFKNKILAKIIKPRIDKMILYLIDN